MPSAVFLSPHSDPQADLGEPDSGGQCVYEDQLAKELSQRGWDITTFCRQVGKRPDTSVVNDHYRIRRISCGPAGFIPKEEIAEYLPEFMNNMTPFLPQEKYVIHGHYWDGGKASLYLQGMLKDSMPFVWTPHSLGSSKREKFPGTENELTYNFVPRLAWENYSCFAAEKVIVSSPQEKENVVRSYGYDEEKIEIISPGVSLDDLVPHDQAEMRQRYALPQEGKMLLCLGRMTRSKGYHHAIRALSWLKEQYAEPVYLVICGGAKDLASKEEREYKQYLQQVTAELQLEKEVVFLPAIRHEKVAELYSAADIFIMSSENEPFGLTVLESMSMGLPVVASNTGGPTFLIQHNFTGSLVTIYNPRRVAHYIYSYLKDPQFTQRVIKNAREFANTEFDWKNQAKKFSDLYEKALQRSDAPNFHDWMDHNHFLKINLQLQP